MSMIWRWISRFLLTLLALFMVLAAIWTYGRLTSPTEAQRDAVAVMEAQPPMAEGENGFELLLNQPPAPEEPFPATLQCGDAGGRSCIDVIEAAPEASAAAIEAWRPRLDVAQRALRAPVFRDLRERVSSVEAIPAHQDTLRLNILRALQFTAGDTLGALAQTCEDAAAAMRWASSPDNLIDSMVGIAVFRRNAILIADMRQRAPSDALPESCAELLRAPDPAEEGLLCNALRGEWRYQTRTVWPELDAEIAREGGAAFGWLLHDTTWQLAVVAQQFAPACGESARERARQDRVPDLEAGSVRWVDRVAYPAGAIIADIAAPAYADYFERQLDHVARRRLLAALLQMDVMDAALTPQQRFSALPDDLRNGPRPLALTDDGRTLTVQIRGHRSDDQEPNGARLPLRLSPAAASAEPTEPAPVQ